MINVLAAACIGLLSGLHAACWGMYKDASHEDFSLRTYSRSGVLGLTIGADVQPVRAEAAELTHG